MKMNLAVCGLVLCTMIFASSARGDHALRSDGIGVFNVIVEDNVETSAGIFRVRYTSDSFLFNFKRSRLDPLLGREGIMTLTNHVTTSTRVAKDAAKVLMKERGWDTYEVPVPVETAPRVRRNTEETTGIPQVPFAREDHLFKPEVLSDKPDVPVTKQLKDQMDVFILQQQRLARTTNDYYRLQLITLPQTREVRLYLLQRQEDVIRVKYDSAINDVTVAIKWFAQQRESVNTKGYFAHE